ncbi:MAG: hypothetical protein KDE15_04020 [Erythrobacter sp.]|nr:hypothetical protein [Erythrobacter sp.]
MIFGASDQGQRAFLPPGVPIPEGIDIDSLPVMPRDPLIDLYRPVQLGSWALYRAPMVVCQGYWSGIQRAEPMVALLRRNAMWMSLSPLETESQRIGIQFARGHVVIFGLGMGWAAAHCALKSEVERVTVVELDDEVIALNAALDLFGQLPGGAGAKVQVIHGDALEWTPHAPVDLLMPDIWLDMVSWERAEEVHDMQANVRAAMVYFWGQELELARHAVKAGQALDEAGLAATAATFDLPLVGLDTPDYAARTRRVTQAWMNGRWLEGTLVPPDLRGPLDSV